MSKEKKPQPKKKDHLDFLKNLEGEDQMHDDYGPVIIGGRERKPKIPDEEEKKRQK